MMAGQHRPSAWRVAGAGVLAIGALALLGFSYYHYFAAPTRPPVFRSTGPAPETSQGGLSSVPAPQPAAAGCAALATTVMKLAELEHAATLIPPDRAAKVGLSPEQAAGVLPLLRQLPAASSLTEAECGRKAEALTQALHLTAEQSFSMGQISLPASPDPRRPFAGGPARSSLLQLITSLSRKAGSLHRRASG